MQDGRLTDLGGILSAVGELDWRAWVFLPPDVSSWQASTPAFVIRGDAIPEDRDVPDYAAQRGLTRELGVVAIEDVVENWNESAGRAGTQAELLSALQYYAENDAFVNAPG